MFDRSCIRSVVFAGLVACSSSNGGGGSTPATDGGPGPTPTGTPTGTPDAGGTPDGGGPSSGCAPAQYYLAVVSRGGGAGATLYRIGKGENDPDQEIGVIKADGKPLFLSTFTHISTGYIGSSQKSLYAIDVNSLTATLIMESTNNSIGTLTAIAGVSGNVILGFQNRQAFCFDTNAKTTFELAAAEGVVPIKFRGVTGTCTPALLGAWSIAGVGDNGNSMIDFFTYDKPASNGAGTFVNETTGTVVNGTAGGIAASNTVTLTSESDIAQVKGNDVVKVKKTKLCYDDPKTHPMHGLPIPIVAGDAFAIAD